MTRCWAGPIGDIRHSFVTHLLKDGSDIRTAQERLSHRDVSISTICTHVLNWSGRGVRSPWETPAELSCGRS
ncbi:MAG: tyrosine-type recombinase/integrase [Kofleriaceae bacterium]|nr:tyrosine-type recombinase/integrase [Candidatus Methylomirabilis lanthanidiphila]